MEVGLVRKIDIDREMQQAYLDYAMSVIVARALPDARDGLKPVHRRILYAMYDMGLRPDSPYKKSARIVGEVLGKYHPHGDMAVYEAMARMAQDFSMRCLLVDGQGNFGSVDGDSPAAMRYTEARLTPAAMQLLADIQKDTVDFEPNFDDTLKEPRVLPAAFPNLLVNGATGIAVGMSTSIPPHNLGEVVDALCFLLDNWEKMEDISLEDLMRFIQGPDFPTGGVILQQQGEESLASAYGSGRGRITVQARAHLEEMERGRSRIIVTELPYMTNKASLIERIAELVREEKLVGIADLRDESDRQGMRIVIELTKTADPEAVLQDLYRHTPMQTTFSLIMLALVDSEPRLLTLKQALRVYLDHRLEVVRRRSEHDLAKARQRAHILEGLRIALKHLDEVIDLIRKAPDAETARLRLIKRFKLSEIQAQAILDMQLRRLAALERKKVEEEYKEVLNLIRNLEALLRSPKKMRQVVSDELLAVKESFADRRRTQIVTLKPGVSRKALLSPADLAPDRTIWISITPNGLISRSHADELPRQGGNDAPAWLLRLNTRDTLYLVSEHGEAAALPALSVPETDRVAEGVPVDKISPLGEGQKLAGMFSLPPKAERSENRFILSVTRQGMVKKSPISELPGPSANTFTLVRVNQGDALGWLGITDGESELFLLTARGMAIRFSEQEVRPMGLVAGGVMGIKLQSGDEVRGMEILPRSGEVFMVATDGSAKRVAISQFPLQGRYGQGVVAWKLPTGVQVAGMAIAPGETRATLFLSRFAPRVIRLDAAPLQGRSARGKVLPELKRGEQVIGLCVPREALVTGGGRKETRRRAGARQPASVEAPDGLKKPTSRSKKGAGKTASAKAVPGAENKVKKNAAKPASSKSTSKAGAAKAEAADKSSAKRSVSSKTSAEKAQPQSPTSKTTQPVKPSRPKTRPASAGSHNGGGKKSAIQPDPTPNTSGESQPQPPTRRRASPQPE